MKINIIKIKLVKKSNPNIRIYSRNQIKNFNGFLKDLIPLIKVNVIYYIKSHLSKQ